MADTNPHTGSRLISKVPTEEFKEGFDRIFGTKKPKEPPPVLVLGEDATQVSEMKPQCCGCCGEDC